jgi:phosphatidylglycerophosphate synthase
VIKARFARDLDTVLHRVFPSLAGIRVRPDTLTFLGVALSAAVGVAFALDHVRIGGVLLVFAGLCDLLDGVVARSQGTSSSAGGFLDSTMDRLADLLVYCGIAISMARQADVGGVALLCWALSASVMTSYVRARAESHLARLEIGLMERAERIGAIALCAIFGYLRVGLWIVAIGATVTTAQRIVLARRLLRELDRTGRDPTEGAAPASQRIRRS